MRMCDNSSFIFIYPSIFFFSLDFFLLRSEKRWHSRNRLKKTWDWKEYDKRRGKSREWAASQRLTAFLIEKHYCFWSSFCINQCTNGSSTDGYGYRWHLLHGLNPIWMRRVKMIHILQRYQLRIIPLSLEAHHTSYIVEKKHGPIAKTRHELHITIDMSKNKRQMSDTRIQKDFAFDLFSEWYECTPPPSPLKCRSNMPTIPCTT